MKWKDHKLIRTLILLFGIAFLLSACWDEDHRGLIFIWMLIPAAWRNNEYFGRNEKQASFRLLVIGYLIALLIFTFVAFHFGVFANPILTTVLLTSFVTSVGALEYKLRNDIQK